MSAPVAEPQIEDELPDPQPPAPPRRVRVRPPQVAELRATAAHGIRQSRRGMERLPVTPFGVTVIGGTLLAWLAGAILGWLELSTMAAIGLLLLLLAIPFTLGRPSVAAQLELNTLRVVVGERAAGELVVRNTSPRRQLPFDLELPVGESAARFSVPSLRPDETHDELLIIPTERRGIVPVGPASAVRGDPLGLLRRARPAGELQLLYVHPVTVRTGHLGFGLLRDLEGAESTVLSNSDVAFHALREYVPGDDRRHIHWKSSARANRLMVRQFVDTRRSHMTIVLSTDRAHYATDDEFELAVSAVGSIGLQALRDEQQLTVLISGRQLPSLSGQRLMDALAGVELGHRADGLASNRTALGSGAGASSLIITVAGSRLEPGRMRADGQRLAKAGSLLCLRVHAAADSGFSVVGGVPTLTLADLCDLRRLLRAAS